METNSRKQVIDSARELFIAKGKDGVRMQEIADHAEVNKGLLHYYFKSKDNLFREVFIDQFDHLYGDIKHILASENTLDYKLAAIVDRYFDLLKSQPKLPLFVLFELNKHPELAKELSGKLNLQETIRLLDAEFHNNRITSTPQFAFQVLLNIVSLCIFPFMMKTMVTELSGNDASWETMMAERQQFLKGLIINSLKP